MDRPENQIRRIVVERMDRCNICHRAFAEDDVEVISRKNDMWMMLVQCQDCHARNFVAAVVGDTSAESFSDSIFDLATSGVEFREIESDDAADDVAIEVRDGDPVTFRDVIAMHSFLEAFDGDFKRLFGAA
jgi:hypothetical protein